MKLSIPLRAAAALVLAAYGLSAFLAAGPRAVLCHKADGRIDLEFESAPGECNCEKCAHCREHRLLEILGLDPEKTILKALHCTHEELFSDSDGAAALQKGKTIIQPDDGMGREYLAAGLIPFSPPCLFWAQGQLSKAPPPIALSLRC